MSESVTYLNLESHAVIDSRVLEPSNGDPRSSLALGGCRVADIATGWLLCIQTGS